MNISVGALLRSLVAAGLSEGLSYNETYHAVSQGGVSVISSQFAAEYRYIQGLNQNTIELGAAELRRNGNLIPTADKITSSVVDWPDRFNARVRLFGRDSSTGQFASKWVNVGYSRLPSLSVIADTAMVLASLGDSDPEFTPFSVTGVTVEESASFAAGF